MFNLLKYNTVITDSIIKKLVITHSLQDTLAQVNEKRKHGVTILSFVNAHAVNLAQKASAFHQALIQSDILLRDGVGVKILLKARHVDYGFNANGTDFIPYLLNQSRNKKIALFGATQDSVTKAAQKLIASGYTVCHYDNGFHPSQYYLDYLQSHDVDIVILGMGMPRQELLAAQIKSTINKSMLVVNGGAIIDFMGGTVTRAPQIYRSLGLEWLYRLLLEPKRLWKRYIVGNVAFLLGVCIMVVKK